MRAAISFPATNGDTQTIPVLARLLLQSKGDMMQAREMAESKAMPERVRRILKSPIDPGSIGGWGSSLAGDYRTASDGFLAGLRTSSVFFAMLDSLVKVPLRTRLSIVTGNASGYVRGQGSARRLSSAALENSAGIEPLEAAAIVVITEELARMEDSAAEAMLSAELKAAAASAVDSQFVSVLSAAATTSASIGFTTSAAVYDIRTMFDAITISSRSKLFWIGAVDVAKRASTLSDGSQFLFPEMSPLGGEMRGIPFLVCDQLAAGKLLLVDAAGLMGNADLIRLEKAKEALIQMDSAPDSPATASTVYISLFQENKVALLARTTFGVEVFQDNAVIEKTSIAWGNSADSPA